MDEARRNEEVVSLADSQVLRWIDELNGIYDADSVARRIKSEIRAVRREADSLANRRRMKALYAELDAIQFKPDYMCLIIDRPKDYHRACRGFSINGVSYKRLLGTNGGIKNSTIVFVSERLHGELSRRIENERNPDVEFVPAKLEAYKALSCSASNPVSLPNGIVVVNDAETEFLSDVTYITDEEDGEPVVKELHSQPITINASDGFGLMLPSLAERWSDELDLGYVASGVNTRFAYEKGMVYTFDFLEFAGDVAGTYIIKDAWGDEVDVRNVELILTTSMVKLWDSYESCEQYISSSLNNNYTFGIAKTCPEVLENERRLNYQFVQSYDLTDADIDELIAPTVNEMRGVLGGDVYKTILFLKGVNLSPNGVCKLPNDYVKALMINPDIINDPFVQSSIYQAIKNRIDQAKVGALKVHGNYSMISGDPYLLCQSIFGLKKTGLLGAGEIYNEYWASVSSDKLVCFRAPMTSHANIRLVTPTRGEAVRHWYQYMHTVTVLNGWDTITMALNGADYDGDLVMLTDNDVLVRKHKAMPALMCVQRKASKCKPTESDFIASNIESFGNEIGQTTNWITSMFEVRAGFDSNSEEYRALSYRIKCGQLYQQNVIDKAKGIIAKPMPRTWHDRHAVNKMTDEGVDGETVSFYRRTAAVRKPYFMRYIYPSLMKQYNTYMKNTNRNALREFRLGIGELQALPYKDLTDRQRDFLYYYEYRMPVGTNDCVMNRICRRIENEFDGHLARYNSTHSFDYKILSSGASYIPAQYTAIKRLYDSYMQRIQNFVIYSKYERVDDEERRNVILTINNEFRRKCDEVCAGDQELCEIVLDICYQKNATRKFAWGMCGGRIIKNLLDNTGGRICFPVLSDGGAIEFNGMQFTPASINYYEWEEANDCS